MTDFMRSRNMEEDMAEDDIFGVWEWMDGFWLYRSYIYITIIVIITIIVELNASTIFYILPCHTFHIARCPGSHSS